MPRAQSLGWKPLTTLLYGCVIGCIVSSTFYFAISGVFSDRNRLPTRHVRVHPFDEAQTTRTPPGNGFVSVVRSAGLPLRKEDFDSGIERIARFVIKSPVAGSFGRPETIAAEYHQRRTLLVAVLASRKDAENTAAVINKTWGAEKTSNYEIFVGGAALGDCAGDPALLSLPEMDAAEHDSVPELQLKTHFNLLKYLHQHYARSYNWFLIAPTNTFISVADMEDVLKKLDSSTIVYMGRPSSRQPLEMAQWRMMVNEFFCESGPGIVLSQAALAAVYPHLDKCLAATEQFSMASWPDVELGRCFSRKVGIRCSSSAEVSTVPL